MWEIEAFKRGLNCIEQGSKKQTLDVPPDPSFFSFLGRFLQLDTNVHDDRHESNEYHHNSQNGIRSSLCNKDMGDR